MAALVKAVRVSKAINKLTKHLTNFSLSSKNFTGPSTLCKILRPTNFATSTAAFHTSSRCSDLMEFFDEPKNWGQNEVKVGRSWKKDELRIKSNEDLHKLWYVLLKEKNMLLTMERACKTQFELFPSPERLDKVEDSMQALEQVVKERNTAYHLLETGETGLRPIEKRYNQIGLPMRYKLRQYRIPKHMNSKWHENHKFGFGGMAVRKFLRLYNEKKWNQRRKILNRQKNHVKAILRKFPNPDHGAIKKMYPKVDIEKLKRINYVRGHFLPK